MPAPPGPAFRRPEDKLNTGIHLAAAQWIAGSSPAMTDCYLMA
jgi:hypothetical protein